MQTRKTVRLPMKLFVGFALVAAACGSDAAEVDETTTFVPTTIAATTASPGATSEASETTPPPTLPATTITPTSTVAPTTTVPPTTTIALAELPLLEASLGETIGEFRVVPPGVYRSDALPVALRVDLQAFEPAVAWIEPGSFVMLSLPDYGLLTQPTLFLIPIDGLPEVADAAVHEHDLPAVPVAQVADIDEFFEAVPGVVLRKHGEEVVSGSNAPWWEFTTETSGDGYSCPYGSNCYNVVMVSGAGPFIAGEAFIYRLWRLADGGLYAWLQAPVDQWDSALDLGAEFLDGITVE